ncbi:DUF6882 domain-containing protein [Asticcacaulis benevestitus]|uniref:Uncharacterized protein n=1 Tax=Asticcacaulis benevestitus DSM 16100 = ATCC BAA-896 TaxID=1121022 RepID=V4PEP0_9CAUL|nr:DUF6882 domain-containing protein [Asticcacaulis benevestitus]ESQ92417.1 hypothetical protein ABENE_08555 [Asticcacaulis benevestitus DSM 16100 = ATCC BAA-896]
MSDIDDDGDVLGAPEWYAEWRHEAVHQLMDKQAHVRKIYGINDLPRYDYDVEAQQLTFSENGVVKVVADIQVVGTVSPKDWLWGWANTHWPEPVVADLERVVSFGEENSIQELISGYVTDVDLNQLGWELTAVAVRVLDAVGAYRPPSETGALFLLIKSNRFVS